VTHHLRLHPKEWGRRTKKVAGRETGTLGKEGKGKSWRQQTPEVKGPLPTSKPMRARRGRLVNEIRVREEIGGQTTKDLRKKRSR